MARSLAILCLFAVIAVGGGGSVGSASGTAARHAVLAYDRSGTIWIAHPDGSGARRLTKGFGPVVSPDGRWVAFTRGGAAGFHVLWIRTSGGRVHSFGGAYEPDGWSADSSALLVSVGDTSAPDLAVVEPETGKSTVFARSGPRVRAGTPVFSPDGRKIAFVRGGRYRSDVFAYDRLSRKTTQLTTDHTSNGPVWGPQWIAYFDGPTRDKGQIWLMDGFGQEKHQLTHAGSGIFPVYWSASGAQLVGAWVDFHQADLWAVDPASGAETRLGYELRAQGLSQDGSHVLAGFCAFLPDAPNGPLVAIPFAGGPAKVLAKGTCSGSWNL